MISSKYLICLFNLTKFCIFFGISKNRFYGMTQARLQGEAFGEKISLIEEKNWSLQQHYMQTNTSEVNATTSGNRREEIRLALKKSSLDHLGTFFSCLRNKTPKSEFLKLLLTIFSHWEIQKKIESSCEWIYEQKVSKREWMTKNRLERAKVGIYLLAANKIKTK